MLFVLDIDGIKSRNMQSFFKTGVAFASIKNLKLCKRNLIYPIKIALNCNILVLKMIYFLLHDFFLFQFRMAGISIKNWINRISQLDLCLLCCGSLWKLDQTTLNCICTLQSLKGRNVVFRKPKHSHMNFCSEHSVEDYQTFVRTLIDRTVMYVLFPYSNKINIKKFSIL